MGEGMSANSVGRDGAVPVGDAGGAVPMAGQAAVSPVLAVERVGKRFPLEQPPLRRLRDWWKGRPAPVLQALREVSFTVGARETLALVGESGSGKSTLARVMVGIWPNVSGEVLLDGRPIQGWDRTELGPHLGYLPQDIELFDGTIAENIARFSEVDSGKVIAAATSAGLHQMILRFPQGYDTPIGEAGGLLSGGQRQRIGIARALATSPRFVVLDEPVSALDVSVRAQVLNLLVELQERSPERPAYLFIGHDLSVVACLADRIAVMYLGRIVELADSATLYRSPLHPYTKALLSAVPLPDPRKERSRRRVILKGDVPSPSVERKGCPFRERCPEAMERCAREAPSLKSVGEGHEVSCFLFGEA